MSSNRTEHLFIYLFVKTAKKKTTFSLGGQTAGGQEPLMLG